MNLCVYYRMNSPQVLNAIRRFYNLPSQASEKVYADANTILDDIISHCHTIRKPHENLKVDEDETAKLVDHGCWLLQNSTVLLRSKFAQVLNILLVNGKFTFHKDLVNFLVAFLCNSLSISKSSLVTEFLKALAIVLYSNGTNLSEENLSWLLGGQQEGALMTYLQNSDCIIRGHAVQCMGNLALRSSTGERIATDHISLCFSTLLNSLRLYTCEESDSVDYFKLISRTLKSIQNVLGVISVKDGIVEAEFCVALLKVFLMFGIGSYKDTVKRLLKNVPDFNDTKSDEAACMYNSKKKEKSAMTKKVHPRKQRKKRKSKLDSPDAPPDFGEHSFMHSGNDSLMSGESANWRKLTLVSSSESEFSDSEMNSQDQLKQQLILIRYNSAKAILDVLRCCDRKTKFSCWLSLVPASISDAEPSLLYSLALEQSIKVRPAAQLALMELIDGSKGFLHSASVVGRPAAQNLSFTPFSVKLKQSVNILHQTLVTSLGRELADTAKERVVKCLTLLILNAPYQKIGAEMLPTIIKSVANLLYAKEASLRQSTLTCLAAIMSAVPGDDQISSAMLSAAECIPRFDGESEIEGCWITVYCLEQLNMGEVESRISSECIQVLTVIMRTFPVFITDNQRNQIIDCVCAAYITSIDITLVLHSIKILEEISKAFAKNKVSGSKAIENNEASDQKTFEASENEENEALDGNESEALDFWRRMLSGPVPYCTQYDSSMCPAKIQSAVCDWMSNIGAEIFYKMHMHEQIYMKTLLIGLSDSSEIVLCAAAIRALGVLVEYPCMEDDIWFIVDVSRLILKYISHSSMALRIKVTWALANTCESMGKYVFFHEECPQDMVLELLKGAIATAKDNEKVSTNGVRALGNLLKTFSRDVFEDTALKSNIAAAVTAIADSVQTGPMKSRWNGCYACLYIFQNPSFPFSEEHLITPVYNALIASLEQCKNFKVRISAVNALLTPTSRQCYGSVELFGTIWSGVLSSLESSEEMEDFTEFKYKETLQNQILLMLLHLLGVATIEDVSLLRKGAQQHQHIFLQHLNRCISSSHTPNMYESATEFTSDGKQIVTNGDSVSVQPVAESIFAPKISKLVENLNQLGIAHGDTSEAVDVICNALLI